MSCAGLKTTLVSSTLPPGRWRAKIEGDTSLLSEFVVLTRERISEMPQPQFICLARPAGLYLEDLALVSEAWRMSQSAIYTFANGLWTGAETEGANRFVLNFAISGFGDPGTAAAVINVRAVERSYVPKAGLGAEVARIYQNVAGLPVQAVDDRVLRHELYRKVILNSVANGVAAITAQSMRQLAESAPLYEGIDSLAREGSEVLGLEMDSLHWREWLAAGGDHIPSTARAILHRRSNDIDFLNGAIVARASVQKRLAPYNNLVTFLARNRIRLSAEDLAACFGNLHRN